MRKFLVLLASAALLLVGCAKEQLSNGVGPQDGEMTTVSFTASLDNIVATKAAADGDGAAASVNRCIMEIYYGDALYARQYAKVENKVATFTAQVVSNRTYTVAFWADCVVDAATDTGLATDNYYTTTSLKEIALNGSYVGNDDARDAFYHVDEYTVAQAGTSFPNIKLTRPFAQMNIITTDWDKADKVSGLAPEKVKVTLKNALVKFNALTKTASGSENLEYTADVYAPAANGAEMTLSMDYLFASTAKALIDIDWKALHGTDAEVEHSFASVPYQRNYRTNVKGALLTTQGQWTVTVDSDWTGNGSTVEGGVDPYLVNYYQTGSIAAANEALKTKNAVSIENPTDLGADIIIPSEQDGKTVLIKVTGASAGAIVVNKATDNGPAALAIESDSKTLDIELPNSHVDVNKGVNYTSITAKTGDNTLVIGKDVVAAALDVQKGSVEIHGKVATLTRANGVKAEMYASDRATLINYIKWAKAGDIAGLECDIDLAGENWTPLRSGNRFTAVFDGQGHTISNMTIATDMQNGVGFFSDMTGGAVIKNFTMTGADISNTNGDKGNMWGIISGYAYGNVTFENITVTDSKIHAFGKVAGILGMAADAGGTTVVKNCKVENTEIIGCYNVANYVGLVQNAIILEGCTSTNVEKKLGRRYGEESYVTFDNVKVINNDTENPKYVLSSGKYWEYAPGLYYAAFADCYNDIHYLEWKALDGTVDALVFNTPDTPELKDLEPVATIGEKKYYDLPSALAALQQGETLEIVQAGEYTVETLTTPANITIDAKVDGVVFKHTPSDTSWLTNQVDGRTVKNITWNVGTAHHQYLHGVNLVNCKIEGMICTHSNSTYTDCEFYNEDSYNLWEYGTGSTFIGCKFTCPGGPDGKGGVINAYNEGHQEGLKTVILKDCEFIALETSDKYSVMYIKPETDFDVQFVNCTYNDKFCTGDKSGSKLWNVKAHTNLNTKVTVDGKLVYANGTVLDITTADQLMAFAAKVNAGNNFEGKTVYLGADIDMTGKAWIPIGNVNDYPGKAFYGVFDGQNHIVSNLTCTDNTENYACAGFFGSIMGTVKNLTLKNVNISSKHYAAGIVAYCSSSDLDVENCHVIGGTITSTPELLGGVYDNGDKAGGIVGLAAEAGKITGCTVDGVTVRAYRDLGGILGAGSSTISNCVVKNSSVIQDNTNAYKTGIDTYHEILGRDMGATLNGNTFENVTVTTTN